MRRLAGTKSYESYKARWLEHERREDEANESRRQDACRVAVKLAKTLSESYTLKKIILFTEDYSIFLNVQKIATIFFLNDTNPQKF